MNDASSFEPPEPVPIGLTMLKIARDANSTTSHLHPLLSKLFPQANMRNDIIGQKRLETLNDKLARVVHVMEQRAVEKKERPKKNELKDDSSMSSPAVKTIVALTTVPVGGSVMSLRDEKGHESVLIGYSRCQLVRASRSPFALLPPSTMRDLVSVTPEIVAPFPRRHPPSRVIHNMDEE
ncbi:hypothetical protein PFISCL1PPCAC_19994 [Pristionchus fissidentatus]|uniref:Uncharacterized protein n=1 Tax=Pristionchus fissidentatus TaxID=1538716 RepID=A0AAV5WCF2_9BILA|nr:hypothetical protein PFISCL1PPCAC_19994 [Pristionchus fissidentatus]